MKTQSRSIILATGIALVAMTTLGIGALALHLPDMRPSLSSGAASDDSCPPDACTIVFKSLGGVPSDMRTASNDVRDRID